MKTYTPKKELSFKGNNELAKAQGFKFNWASKLWECAAPTNFEVVDVFEGFAIYKITETTVAMAVDFDSKEIAKKEGFSWDKTAKKWIKSYTKPESGWKKCEELYTFDESIQSLLKTKLFDYQKKGIAVMCAKNRYINADQMGLGKTLQAIGAVVKTLEAGKKVLIISPAFLKYNWKAEFEKHCINQYATKVLTSKDLLIGDAQVCIVNYDIIDRLERDFFSCFEAIICDEAHALKSESNKRVDAFKAQISNSSDTKVLFLTGTPIKNRVPELFNFIAWCGLFDDNQSSRYYFCDDYSFKTEKKFKNRKVITYEGIKNSEALNNMLSHIMIKRESSEVLDLPEMSRIEIFSEIEKKTDKKIFEELAEAFESYDESHKGDHIMQLRAKASMMKVADTVALASDILEAGEQLVIFDCFKEPVAQIKEALGKEHEVALIDGSVSMEARQAIVEKFQAGEIRCIVATIGALSTGVTLTAASKLIFNALSWVPADNLQAEKRIHRIGSKNQCFIYRMVKTSFDKKITRLLAAKEAVIESALKI